MSVNLELSYMTERIELGHLDYTFLEIPKTEVSSAKQN